jgi:hypothetical protein
MTNKKEIGYENKGLILMEILIFKIKYLIDKNVKEN